MSEQNNPKPEDVEEAAEIINEAMVTYCELVRRILIILDKAYYDRGESIVSDRVYDDLFDSLEMVEEYAGMEDDRSPTQVVGFNADSYRSLLNEYNSR